MLMARHAESSANAAGELVGRGRDPGLTSLGREQADRLAAAIIARTSPCRVVSSPLARTRETASVVAAAFGVAVEVDDRLAEIEYGEWEGLGIAHLATPEGQRWRTDPSFAPPGGESLSSVRVRVASFCAEYMGVTDTAAAPEDLVVFSHVSPIKAAVVWALGVDDAAVWRMFLGLASISAIGRRGNGETYLETFNDIAHLR